MSLCVSLEVNMSRLSEHFENYEHFQRARWTRVHVRFFVFSEAANAVFRPDLLCATYSQSAKIVANRIRLIRFTWALTFSSLSERTQGSQISNFRTCIYRGNLGFFYVTVLRFFQSWSDWDYCFKVCKSVRVSSM